ncbi:hypothetical protein [Streptomyces triticiradicis]|uniref:hypothetical protein n=1 Tax=Streptomyces triticiradicis TaxID=2651189 RepID=UPI001788AFEB|nr:hypothetical protein [Streptomyces triticiradicis]
MAAGVQDAARVQGEVIAVLGERGVFGEDERGDDGGFTHVLVTVLEEGRDGPIKHRAQVPEGCHGGAGGEEAREALLDEAGDLVGGVVERGSQPTQQRRADGDAAIGPEGRGCRVGEDAGDVHDGGGGGFVDGVLVADQFPQLRQSGDLDLGIGLRQPRQNPGKVLAVPGSRPERIPVGLRQDHLVGRQPGLVGRPGAGRTVVHRQNLDQASDTVPFRGGTSSSAMPCRRLVADLSAMGGAVQLGLTAKAATAPVCPSTDPASP